MSRYDLEFLKWKFKSSYNHFNQRLKERYGKELSETEYNLICLGLRQYQGIFSKNNDNSVGILKLEGVNVYCLYNNRLKLFTTCYPDNLESDINSCIQACFPRPLRGLAHTVLKTINRELDNIFTFKSAKQAALFHFENSYFPSLLMDQYRHGVVNNFKICSEINKVIKGTHPSLELNVTLQTKSSI